MKKNIALALLTGILLALSFPPFKSGFIAYGALIPFFILLENKHGRTAWRWGYITGLCIAVFTLSWIAWATFPGLIGVLMIWPLYIALFAWLFTFLYQRFSYFAYMIAPFLWTSIEYLQSLSELAFPWNHLGYTQSYFLPLIQYAEFTSVYGVSFWIVLINILLLAAYKFHNIRRQMATAIALTAIVFAIPLFYGLQRMKEIDPNPTIKVSLIQGNLDPNEKWDIHLYENNFALYEQLTVQALKEKPDLVVWPETAVPFYLRSEPKYLAKLHTMLDSSFAALLTGSLDYKYLDDGSYIYYNCAFFLESGRQRLQHYDKMKLVPFSERVPYKKYFPFNVMKKVFWNFGLGDYGLGKAVSGFDGRFRKTCAAPPAERTGVYDYKTAVAICYEADFSEHVRKYVNNGAELLVLITNDAWFGKTSAPFQHNQIAVFRAIENRRDIARCANTGISCFIDHYGRVRNATKIYTQAAITGDVRLNDERTFFTRRGHVFVAVMATISCLTLIAAFIFKLLKR
jgi:apolipoprotein N-acyltransferase